MSTPRRFGPLIGSVDEGTSKARFFVSFAFCVSNLIYCDIYTIFV